MAINAFLIRCLYGYEDDYDVQSVLWIEDDVLMCKRK